MHRTQLDVKWDALMALCDDEQTVKERGSHPKLLKLVAKQIEQLAAEIGFTPEQIHRREFRAVRDGRRVVRVLTQ